ncbi:hypothetical protein [Pseudobutyrivibrio sp.]|uniref:hypothetical protein n=1 Tax=Pseudobutyrivibrio sp. TaxID=2014367 RepID=UPI001DF44C6C|nr:hypothetical protein [Pseudobutyrivibrio sp.]MBE5910298.1 hypothetical protein [Pseudobutyrivibrio sp.]
MKRIITILMCITLTFGITACGKNEDSSDATETATTTPQVKPIESTEEGEPQEEETNTSDEIIVPDDSVDIDLTAMSATFVYSEVYNMIMTPDDYIGKTIKMEGICNMYEDPESGQKYYACIVQDATQCCSQGLEFVLDADQYTEDDYPQVGDDITIIGTFATYMEGENRYLTMLDSKME